MKIIKFIKTNFLFSFVIMIYILLLVFSQDKGLYALDNSSYYLKEMITIMPIVFLMTVLIDVWIKQDQIINNLGEKSGVKGIIFSLLLGSISAGPIYGAFPICSMLLNKGASITNIMIIISSWAVIKIPMLVNEMKFLGPQFMILRWILTVGAIIVLGIIAPRFIKNPIVKKINHDKPLINQTYCVGCGICKNMMPNNFYLENKKAFIFNEDNIDLIRLDEVIIKCPTKAIQK